MHSDGQDFLLVCAVARGLKRAEFLERAQVLLIASMAHHGKSAGMVIVEREEEADVTMLRESRIDAPEATAAGVAPAPASTSRRSWSRSRARAWLLLTIPGAVGMR